MKAVDSMWFNTAQGSFGIVLGQDEITGEFKVYAGIATCLNQQADEELILSYGNKVNIAMLMSMISRVAK